jgi:DNA polymerase sigma
VGGETPSTLGYVRDHSRVYPLSIFLLSFAQRRQQQGIAFTGLITFSYVPRQYVFVPDVPACKALQVAKSQRLLVVFLALLVLELGMKSFCHGFLWSFDYYSQSLLSLPL